jgi:hypothetical protein
MNIVLGRTSILLISIEGADRPEDPNEKARYT